MKKKIRNDLILVGVLLLIAALLFLFTAFADKGTLAVVTLDGELYGEYSTDKDMTVEINGTNTLVIKNGVVYMESACCENQTCVKQGRISKEGESIICLPNRITVTLSDGKGSLFDADSYDTGEK